MSKKAYALHTLHRKPDESGPIQVVQASTAARPSIVDMPVDEFKQMEKLGAVRLATADEIAVFKAQADLEMGALESVEEIEELDPPEPPARVETPKHNKGGRPAKQPKDDEV